MRQTNTADSDVDQLFDQPRPVADFAFDEAVTGVFPDMIRRSVPGYDTVTALVGVLAARHLPDRGRCYDLGCSLGAATHAVLHAVGTRPCQIVAVDDSEAMLARARDLAGDERRIRWQLGDIREVEVAQADVVIVNYTLQFLPPEARLPLLRRLRDGMRETGVLLMAEKLAGSDYLADLHLDFKRANGYSDLAISQKRQALERIMRIDTEAAHVERLREAGFADVEVWFRCLNWGAFAAFPKRRHG